MNNSPQDLEKQIEHLKLEINAVKSTLRMLICLVSTQIGDKHALDLLEALEANTHWDLRET
jgi:hypothetical protein